MKSIAKELIKGAGKAMILCLLLGFLIGGSALSAPPSIVIDYPVDYDSTGNSYMDLGITVSADSYPLTVWIYGDSTAGSDLLHVVEDLSGETTIPFSWRSQRLDTDLNTVGLWHFDENTDTVVNDASGSGNIGYFVNSPPDGSQWTADGRFGYGLDFDGTDDYVTIPDLDNSLDVDSVTGILTMEAWLYPHHVGGGVYHAFLSKRDNTIATAVNYALYLDDNNGALTLYNGTYVVGAGYYQSTILIPANEWSYIAVSLDAAEGVLRFYRNGVLEDEIPGASFGPDNDSALTIGTSRTPSGDRCFDGLIDDVRITKRLMTAQEITNNYRLNRNQYLWKVEAIDNAAESTVSALQHFDVGLVIDPPADATVAEGDNLSILITATNPDLVPISLSSSTPPANGNFSDHGNGTGTFDFNPDYDQAGGYSITFYANDGIESAAHTMNIIVTNTNRPPVVSDIPDATIAEGGSFATIDLTGYVTDPDLPIDDAIAWSYSGNFDLSVDITADIATITIPDEDWFGDETITFRATDLGGLYDEDNITFTVTNVNDPPVVDEVGDEGVIICNNLTFPVATSDIDGFVEEITASTAPSGDLPPSASFTNLGDGAGSFSWTPNETQVGVYSIRFTAVDDSGATGYDDMTITVEDDVSTPSLSLTSPSNGTTISDSHMQLTATVSDEGPLTVKIYGGYSPIAPDLLSIEENIEGPDVVYDWNTPILQPDPINTVGLWHLDDDNGYTVNDASGHGNNGQLTGTLPVWTIDGKFGYAVDFNGSDNYMLVYQDPSLDIDSATGVVSIEIWVLPHDDGNDNCWRGLVAKRGMFTGEGPCNYQISLSDQGYLAFYSSGVDWSQEYISTLIPPVDQWSYIAVTLDASEGKVRFYLNGLLEDDIDGVSFGPTCDGGLTIGTAARQIECFDGFIDEVRITKRVLSDGEIAANFSHIGGGDHYWKIVAEDCAGNETVSETRSFTVIDNNPPEVTLITPANGEIAIYPYMELNAEITDESPMTIFIYGGASPNPFDLLYILDNATNTSLSYDWTASALETEPTYTTGLWHFNEMEGDSAIDMSFKGNTGTLMNNPQRSFDGRFGGALDFDGLNDYVTIPDLDNSLDADPITGVLTMEAWIYPHDIGGGTFRSFLSKRDPTNGTEVNYALYLDDYNGALTLYNGTFVAGNGYYISNIIPPINEWSYIAVSLDATEGVLRFYRNGVLEDKIPGTSFGPVNDSALTIGASRTSTDRCFDGLIDDVRVTTRILDSDEIASNYTLDRSTYYWRVCAHDIADNACESEIRYFTTNLFVCGDANGDGNVNVGDAVFLINYVFKGGQAPDPIEAGDANGDGDVNVGDAAYIVFYVFRGGPPPVCL